MSAVVFYIFAESRMNQFAIPDTNAIFLFSLIQTTIQIGMKERCTVLTRASVQLPQSFVLKRLDVPDPLQFIGTVA